MGRGEGRVVVVVVTVGVARARVWGVVRSGQRAYWGAYTSDAVLR